MVIHRAEPIEYGSGKTIWLHLMSDLHIGASNTDHAEIEKELKEAEELDAITLINGDVFELLAEDNRKQYRKDAVHPRLRQSDRSNLEEAKDWALEILHPHRHRIAMIGCGNHDERGAKFYQHDVIAWLVHELRREGSNAIYGGYSGYYGIPFFRQTKHGSNGKFQTIYYHHGYGGGAPATRGIATYKRQEPVRTDADIFWFGHKHNRVLDSTGVRERVNFKTGEVVEETYDVILTGSYMDNAHRQTSEGVMQGRLSTYCEDAGALPQRKGGAFVRIDVNTKGLRRRVMM